MSYCNSSVLRQSFSFQNNPESLDPSYKTAIDFMDCFGREEFHKTDLDILSHKKKGKTLSKNRKSLKGKGKGVP